LRLVNCAAADSRLVTARRLQQCEHELAVKSGAVSNTADDDVTVSLTAPSMYVERSPPPQRRQRHLANTSLPSQLTPKQQKTRHTCRPGADPLRGRPPRAARP